MGCGASKDNIAVEPQRMQPPPHGRDILRRMDTEAGEAKPIDLTSDCICSLYNKNSGVFNDTSAFIHTPGPCLSTSDEDEDDDEELLLNSFDIPAKPRSVVEEGDNDPCLTTALAALSGGKTTVADQKSEVGDPARLEAILSAGLIAEQSDECCALGVLTSQPAILQALLSTGPVITQQTLGADFSTRVGHVAMISGPEPVRWEPTLRKAEIIDLDDQEQDGAGGESAMVDNNTPEQLLLQHEKPADQTEAQPKQCLKHEENALTPATPEPRKSKLPPLTIVPPILVELAVDPFAAKPVLPIVVKQDFMELKTDPMSQLLQLREDSSNDVRLKLKTERSCGSSNRTPTTKSPEWRQHATPDSDIENIDLLEPPELDNLPLLPTLDCHGIHAISATLRVCT